MLELVPDWLRGKATPCGSRETCDPPPVDTDADFLVLVFPGHDLAGVITRLSSDGWTWEGSSEHYQNVAGEGFMSWRKGETNLIVTASEAFHARHVAATAVCKRLNLLDKEDRKAVFTAVLYGGVYARSAP